MLPNASQAEKLRKWFGIYRYVYNKGLEILKNSDYDKTKSTLDQLRERVVNDGNYYPGKKDEWVKDLPQDTRDCAIRELVQSLNTNLASGRKFDISFKSRKKSQSIDIRTERQFNSIRGKYKFLNEIKLTEPMTEEEMKGLKYDVKVQMTKNGEFYLIVPTDVVRNENQVPHRIVSIDPGVRTFLTCYTPDGFIYHIGEGDIGRLQRLNYYKSKLQSKYKTHGYKGRNNIRKALNRMSEKIKDLVDECHKKVTKWLFDNFDMIILPKLDCNSFCRKNMSKKVKNMIKSWRHCSLVDRLKWKNREYPDTLVIEPTEEYTSKTCSACGNIHQLLGAKKEFVCPQEQCRTVFDRDVNGAFNVLLKTITDASKECPVEADHLFK
jgi:putative transposase